MSAVRELAPRNTLIAQREVLSTPICTKTGWRETHGVGCTEDEGVAIALAYEIVLFAQWPKIYAEIDKEEYVKAVPRRFLELKSDYQKAQERAN